MKKQIAEIITERINNGSHNRYEPTAVVATINEIEENDYEVEVTPKSLINNGNSFHHQDVITDLTRAFKVNSYLSIEDNIIVARLF